jgi:hypothetical protein
MPKIYAHIAQQCFAIFNAFRHIDETYLDIDTLLRPTYLAARAALVY